jgi:hypothetical protein
MAHTYTDDEMIYCQFADTDVKHSMLSPFCDEHIGDKILGDEIKGYCTKCEKSPQLVMGMPVKDLIRQIRG